MISAIRYPTYLTKRRLATALAYCFASEITVGDVDVASFSTATPAVISMLSDPSLLGEGVMQGKDTFDFGNPGASPKQVNGGSAIIAQVWHMGREDTKQAIDRVSAALSGWKYGTTVLHRSGILSKWSALVKENS